MSIRKISKRLVGVGAIGLLSIGWLVASPQPHNDDEGSVNIADYEPVYYEHGCENEGRLAGYCQQSEIKPVCVIFEDGKAFPVRNRCIAQVFCNARIAELHEAECSKVLPPNS